MPSSSPPASFRRRGERTGPPRKLGPREVTSPRSSSMYSTCGTSDPANETPCVWASSSVMMSMSQPTSLLASRTFWPLRPMARESWSSSTITSARFSSGNSVIESTWAGFSEFIRRTSRESFHRMMSIFSPPISSMILRMREPRTPTQAPMASTLGSSDSTATLVLYPASRTSLRMVISPSATSGTSSSKSLPISSGWERERMIFTFCGVFLTSTTYPRIRSPTR